MHFKFIIISNYDQCLNECDGIDNKAIHVGGDVLDGVNGYLQDNLVLCQQQVQSSIDETENSNHINKHGICIMFKLLAPIATIEKSHLICKPNNEISNIVEDIKCFHKMHNTFNSRNNNELAHIRLNYRCSTINSSITSNKTSNVNDKRRANLNMMEIFGFNDGSYYTTTAASRYLNMLFKCTKWNIKI